MHFLNLPASLAQHYFVPNPVTGQGLSPKWDFTSSGRFAGNADAFIVGKGVGNLPSPDDASKDVAWLQVQNVQGKIADTVFRFDTVGGQPPSSVSLCFDGHMLTVRLTECALQCTSGQSADVSVNYVSKYSKFYLLVSLLKSTLFTYATSLLRRFPINWDFWKKD